MLHGFMGRQLARLRVSGESPWKMLHICRSVQDAPAPSYIVPVIVTRSAYLRQGLASESLVIFRELLSLKPKTILDILERLYSQYLMSAGFLDSVMKKYGIQSTRETSLEKKFDIGPINYFLSNTRHYSWPKAAGL